MRISVQSLSTTTPARRDRVLRTGARDGYRARGKLPEPCACPDCGAVFRDGRWTWSPRPSGAVTFVCPACLRTRDAAPKGIVRLSGEFFEEHRDEVMRLARHEADEARAARPLERIIAVSDGRDGVMLTTTDVHLACRIGEAVGHAYHGDLRVRHDRDREFVRVTWRR